MRPGPLEKVKCLALLAARGAQKRANSPKNTAKNARDRLPGHKYALTHKKTLMNQVGDHDQIAEVGDHGWGS